MKAQNKNSPKRPQESGWRKRSIVLVGMMGSGKTTVGKRLAARLQWSFADTDAEIEEAAGMPISEIFERFGEAHFRDGERRVIRRIMRTRRKVIATGGGAFCDPETRKLILARSTAIWLDAEIDVLAARVGRRKTRPLLANRDPKEVLTELMEVRRPLYAEAPIRIVSGNGPPDDVVEAIIEKLNMLDKDA